MARIVVLMVVAAVVLGAWSVFFPVAETQYAIVTRFGDPVAVITEPGLQWKYPSPIDRVIYFDKRLLVLDQPAPGEPPKELLTLDKKNIEVSSYTCWKIEDPKRFLENVGTRRDAEAALGDIVYAELGKVLGQHNLQALLSTDPTQLKLEQITERILSSCAEQASKEYGVRVVDFRIKRITFPEQNRGSVFERMRAERKRIATRYRSEGAEAATKIRAEADRQRTEIQAKADREAQEIVGRAEAEAIRIYGEAYGQGVEFFEFVRTLESYKKALPNSTTYLGADHPYLKLLRQGPSVGWTGSPELPMAGVPGSGAGNAVPGERVDDAEQD